jgi:hypothetical protein
MFSKALPLIFTAPEFRYFIEQGRKRRYSPIDKPLFSVYSLKFPTMHQKCLRSKAIVPRSSALRPGGM